MSKATFKGGVHPYDGKDLTKDITIKQILPGPELVFPMSQHIGAPAKPVVEKGDKVLAGQLIGESSGFVSANICSSVSGVVKAVEERMVLNGSKALCVIIENDEKYETIDGYGEHRDYHELSKKTIIEEVKKAGIVGMGGAGFPTHVKLSPKEPEKIDYILINGAECEPYLTSDYRQMLENGGDIIDGIKIMLKLFENAKALICIEDNKPEAIKALIEKSKNEDRIDVLELKTKYPQGSERALIYAATGKKINSGKLPADAGCIVDNISTVIAIYKAIAFNIPLISGVVTLTGDAFATPVNVNVKFGCSYEELIAEGGGFQKEPVKIISGGPMMGFSMFDLNVPITKTASSILALTADDVAKHEPTPCIRCGKCLEVCPNKLSPKFMADAAIHGDYEKFEKQYHGMECYECGSCAYICPARRPLTQAFKEARAHIAAQRRKK